MGAVIAYIQSHWIQIVAALWLIEQALRAISELTPWKWDDNIVKVIAKILKSFFPNKVTTTTP